MNNRPQRQLSQGELTAYQMGMEMARSRELNRTQRVRREVQIREHEVILIEETWIEETYYER